MLGGTTQRTVHLNKPVVLTSEQKCLLSDCFLNVVIFHFYGLQK